MYSYSSSLIVARILKGPISLSSPPSSIVIIFANANLNKDDQRLLKSSSLVSESVSKPDLRYKASITRRVSSGSYSFKSKAHWSGVVGLRKKTFLNGQDLSCRYLPRLHNI